LVIICIFYPSLVRSMKTLSATHILHASAVVIGTGISGLFTALKLSAQGVDTLLLTKSSLDESNSRYAQGGIAAVLPENREDSLELHLRDTLQAGAGLCDETAARSILSEGYAAIEDLLCHGVPFDRESQKTDDGRVSPLRLALGREAAHSVARILHAGGDATGHSVEMTLIDAVKRDPRITVIEYAPVTELLTADGRCVGCRAVDVANRLEYAVFSPHTVLATGGIGRMYSHTTNPAVATGDGIALAGRAGAAIEGMEFVQFHPTAFYADGKVRFLVSEALRGEGGILRNAAGEAFAARYHPDGELAPRDIVTRAIYSEMRAPEAPTNARHVWLDMTHCPAVLLEARFPTILAHALEFGVDIRRDWIPVAPAAHYLMGGVVVDVTGATTRPGLYAVGEVANTGLHGANRLASNSLLECVVLARRVAKRIAEGPPSTRGGEENQIRLLTETRLSSRPAWGNPPEIKQAREALRSLMWESVGILRDGAGLRRALREIERLSGLARREGWDSSLPAGLELWNQLDVARRMAQAAFARRESLGAHTRTDADPEFSSDEAADCAILLS
jgi:L-aspartate oxidase